MANLKINDINKNFGSTEVLKGINLDINDGDFLVLLGPSGCGKSTLLNTIAGLETSNSGDILIDDYRVNDMEPSDRDIALVFQSYALYPAMTVKRNVTFGLEQRKTPKDKIEESLNRVSSLLKINELLERKPSQLSGGQRQRVAMGRALVRDPKVFLFDEPLSNLDAKLRVEMRREIKKLHQNLKTTVVYVTHDQTEAMSLGTNIAIMNHGVIQQCDTPKNIYQYPKSEYAARLFGKTNIVPLKLIPGVKHFFTQASTGREVVSIRPHQFILQRDENLTSLPEINGTIRNIIDSGHRWIVEIEHKDALFYAEIENNNSINIGDKETFYINLN